MKIIIVNFYNYFFHVVINFYCDLVFFCCYYIINTLLIVFFYAGFNMSTYQRHNFKSPISIIPHGHRHRSRHGHCNGGKLPAHSPVAREIHMYVLF